MDNEEKIEALEETIKKLRRRVVKERGFKVDARDRVKELSRESAQWRDYYYEQVAITGRLTTEMTELKEQRDRDMQMIVDLQSTIDAYGKEK